MEKESLKEFIDKTSKRIYEDAMNPLPLRFWYNGRLMTSSQFESVIKSIVDKSKKD